jgi:hypothetical protein
MPVAVLLCSLVLGSTAMAKSRGELLYTTHCISCHTTQMHWRDNRAATDWQALKAQVRRWQDAASLAWSERDILEVSRYLNDTIYHFKHPGGQVVSWNRFVRGSDDGRAWLAPLRLP